MEHDADLVLFDTEGEEGADEDSHSVDAVHVQDLAEVASDDAAFGADFFDRADGFHGIGDGLVEAWYHGLAVGPDVDSKLREFFHLVQQQLVQFQQGMIQSSTDTEFPGLLGQRQQLLEVGVAEADSDFLGHGHFHDLDNFGKDLAVLAHQPHTAFFGLSGPSPKAQRCEGWKPDHLKVGILAGDADRIGVHSQAGSGATVDFHAVGQFALFDQIINMLLRKIGGIGADVPMVLEGESAHAGLGSVDSDVDHGW